MSDIQFAGHRTITSAGDSLAVTIPEEVAEKLGISTDDAGDHQVLAQFDADSEEFSVDLSGLDR